MIEKNNLFRIVIGTFRLGADRFETLNEKNINEENN